jgi:hypothetical protein
MRWPWQEPALLPNERLVSCPNCSGTKPFSSVILLRSFVHRDGRLVSVVTGERVCCQECGEVFSIGREGTFRHHPQALPLSPSAVGRDTIPAGATRRVPGDEDAPLMPTPKERPPFSPS